MAMAERRQWQDDGTARRRRSTATASQDKAGRRKSTQGDAEQNRATQRDDDRRTMAATSQVKTAALEGGGVLGQTLSFPIADGGALIPC